MDQVEDVDGPNVSSQALHQREQDVGVVEDDEEREQAVEDVFHLVAVEDVAKTRN